MSWAIAIFLLILFFLYFRKNIYPPLYLFLYLLLTPMETFGVGSAIHSRYLNIIISAVFIASAVISFLKLLKQRNLSLMDRRLFVAGSIAAILAFWIYLSLLLYDSNNYLKFLEPHSFAGPYSLIITLAYYRDYRARLLFVLFVFLQVALGVVLIRFPTGFFSMFKASNYFLSQEVFFSPYLLTEFDRDLAVLYGSRLSGQFANPIQLSFFGTIAIALGLYIAKTNRQIIRRILGIIFTIAGLWLQFIVVTRGVFIGLIFGLFLVLTNIRGTIKIVFLLIIIVIFMPFFFSYLTSLTFPPMLQPMIERLKEISVNYLELDDRLLAVKNVAEHFFDSPIFGYGDFTKTLDILEYMPHQAPISLAMIHGIPAGVCLSLLFFLALISDFKKVYLQHAGTKVTRGDNYFLTLHERNLCSVFGWVTIFLAMTNGLAGGSFMWVILAIAILPWAEGSSGKYYSHIAG